mgnify:CR=1 FL=1
MTSKNAVRLALMLLAAGAFLPRLNADATVVSTDKGTIHGIVNGSVVQFLGVPYAAAPVGSLRFRPPQAHASWNGSLEVTKPGNRCPSNQRNMQTPMGEDCLNLGITVPYAVAVPKMPVYVWFHGGGFQNGDAALVDPTASAMATRNNIIIVTGRGKNAIEDHFDVAAELETFLETRGKLEQLEEIRKITNLINVSYVRQGEPLGDTGHAIAVDAVGRHEARGLVLGFPVAIEAIARKFEAEGG